MRTSFLVFAALAATWAAPALAQESWPAHPSPTPWDVGPVGPARATGLRAYTCEKCLQGLTVPDRNVTAWEQAAPQIGESYRRAGESIGSAFTALGAALQQHDSQPDIVPASIISAGARGDVPAPPPDTAPDPGSFQRFDQWQKSNGATPPSEPAQ